MGGQTVINEIYNKTITCPVCSKEFEITKVKSSACKVVSRDSDFCVYYESVNPLLYEALVCEHCGYAALAEKFDAVRATDEKLIMTGIGAKWNKRSFAGERSADTAIEAFKLALYNLHVRKAKASEFTKVCIRLAWLFRFKNDKEKEREFLSFALRSYNEAYEKEKFPVDKLDENTCVYMIAELNRRLDNFDESLKWFSRLIGSPKAKLNPGLLERAREQYQMLREQMK